MITIDGSMGEGGGQVLRSALGLSLVTGEPVLVEHVRAGRERPGLQRQHLAAVLAAAAVGDAAVEGAELGSQRVAFRPRRLRGGAHTFAIGTAGSTTLVLQTVLPGLWQASEPATIELLGGTHNPMAPPADFVQRAFAPVLHRMGASLQVELLRHGFYPAGGGQLRAAVAPAAWRPLELLDHQAPPRLRARIALAGIPEHVGEREGATLQRELGLRRDEVVIEGVPSSGPGNAVVVRLDFAGTSEVVTALGERDVRAEAVAQRVAREVKALIASRAPVGEHLADQLLIPLALAGGGAFRTVAPSRHTRTNVEVVERFLPVRFELRDDGDGTWVIAARPR